MRKGFVLSVNQIKWLGFTYSDQQQLLENLLTRAKKEARERRNLNVPKCPTISIAHGRSAAAVNPRAMEAVTRTS